MPVPGATIRAMPGDLERLPAAASAPAPGGAAGELADYILDHPGPAAAN